MRIGCHVVDWKVGVAGLRVRILVSAWVVAGVVVIVGTLVIAVERRVWDAVFGFVEWSSEVLTGDEFHARLDVAESGVFAWWTQGAVHGVADSVVGYQMVVYSLDVDAHGFLHQSSFFEPVRIHQ